MPKQRQRALSWAIRKALLLVLVPPFMPIRMMTATTMKPLWKPWAPWRLALRSMFPFCCGMMTIAAVLPVPLKAVSWFSPQAMTSRATRSMQTGRSAM